MADVQTALIGATVTMASADSGRWSTNDAALAGEWAGVKATIVAAFVGGINSEIQYAVCSEDGKLLNVDFGYITVQSIPSLNMEINTADIED